MEINPALKYREELIKEVQLVGQEIIDRAEDFGLEPINKEENK